MLARENPHCGVSGVPFINRTTGAEATALSIAARVASERARMPRNVDEVVVLGKREGSLEERERAGLAVCRQRSCCGSCSLV